MKLQLSDVKSLKKVINADEIIFFQNLVRKTPIASNVVEYAVRLSSSTRPKESSAAEEVKNIFLGELVQEPHIKVSH